MEMKRNSCVNDVITRDYEIKSASERVNKRYVLIQQYPVIM
jgi:hypothetical protein